MKKFQIERILYFIGSILLIIALVLGIVQYWQNHMHQETLNELRTQISDGERNTTETNPKKEYISPYEAIFSENADCVAWLKIPDTKVDYPVMHTPREEEYYLYRDFYGEDDKNGCLILAASSDIEAPSTNLLIHGHNMKSGEMFGDLDYYKDISYMQEHEEIRLYTRKEECHYVVMAAFYGKIMKEKEEGFRYYRFFQANSQEEFEEYYRNVKKRSLYDSGVTAQYGDELITLSTCSNVGKEGRFVVVAKRVK